MQISDLGFSGKTVLGESPKTGANHSTHTLSFLNLKTLYNLGQKLIMFIFHNHKQQSIWIRSSDTEWIGRESINHSIF